MRLPLGCRMTFRSLRCGSEAGRELALPGNYLLTLPLYVDGILRLTRLCQDLKLRLLVLQHAELRADPRLQIQDRLLIGRR